VVGIDPSALYSAEYKLVNHPDHLAAGMVAFALLVLLTLYAVNRPHTHDVEATR